MLLQAALPEPRPLGVGPLPDSLRVVTWNIWFGEHGSLRRWQALLLQALCREPDVLCLQEVTAPALELLSSCAWILHHYSISCSQLRQWYDMVVLVRQELQPTWSTIALPSHMGRSCLVTDLCVAGARVRVATVHLESERDHSETRARQLQALLPQLCDVDAVPELRGLVLCGDFNLSEEEAASERLLLAHGLCDLWPRLHGEERGWTKDPERNCMLRDVGTQHHKRCDRVFLSIPNDVGDMSDDDSLWLRRPAAIELLGTAPVLDNLWPSDHFGLFVELAFAPGPC